MIPAGHVVAPDADTDTTLPADYWGDPVCAPAVTHRDYCAGPDCWWCQWKNGASA